MKKGEHSGSHVIKSQYLTGTTGVFSEKAQSEVHTLTGVGPKRTEKEQRE